MNITDKTIHELRKEGFKLRILHSRYYGLISAEAPRLISNFEIRESKHDLGQFWPFRVGVLGKGGRTEIDLLTPDGRQYKASTDCSKTDNFNRKRGIKICLGRIQKQMDQELKPSTSVLMES